MVRHRRQQVEHLEPVRKPGKRGVASIIDAAISRHGAVVAEGTVAACLVLHRAAGEHLARHELEIEAVVEAAAHEAGRGVGERGLCERVDKRRIGVPVPGLRDRVERLAVARRQKRLVRRLTRAVEVEVAHVENARALREGVGVGTDLQGLVVAAVGIAGGVARLQVGHVDVKHRRSRRIHRLELVAERLPGAAGRSGGADRPLFEQREGLRVVDHAGGAAAGRGPVDRTGGVGARSVNCVQRGGHARGGSQLASHFLEREQIDLIDMAGVRLGPNRGDQRADAGARLGLGRADVVADDPEVVGRGEAGGRDRRGERRLRDRVVGTRGGKRARGHERLIVPDVFVGKRPGDPARDVELLAVDEPRKDGRAGDDHARGAVVGLVFRREARDRERFRRDAVAGGGRRDAHARGPRAGKHDALRVVDACRGGGGEPEPERARCAAAGGCKGGRAAE